MSFRPYAAAGTLALLAASPAAADDMIRILAPTWVGFAPVLVAQDLGCYAEECVTLQMSFEDDRTNVLAAMERGDIDADMRTVGEHQGRPRTPETPGKIICTIDISVGGDGVVADGAIATVADLKGKTVAVEPNIPARLLLQMALAKAGLSLADVDLREIATADTIAVFSDPAIAAVGTYEPFLSQTLPVVAERHPHILVSSKAEPVRAPSDGLRAFFEKYTAMHAAGGFWMRVLHPFLTGRLARWQALEAWLEAKLATGDAWFAPLEAIAAHALAHRDRLRVDDLSDILP